MPRVLNAKHRPAGPRARSSLRGGICPRVTTGRSSGRGMCVCDFSGYGDAQEIDKIKRPPAPLCSQVCPGLTRTDARGIFRPSADRGVRAKCRSPDAGVSSLAGCRAFWRYIDLALAFTSSRSPTYKNACSGRLSASPLQIASKLFKVSAIFV